MDQILDRVQEDQQPEQSQTVFFVKNPDRFYEMKERIGNGAFGDVYRVEEDGKSMACKIGNG